MIKTSDVTLAVCNYLHGTGKAVFRATGTYSPSERAITVKHLPAAPDDAVSVTVYDPGDTVGNERREVYFQLRFRAAGALTAVDDFADSIAEHLHEKYRFNMGGLRVSRCRRLNTAPMGSDGNGREERVDNYGVFIVP